MVEGKEKCYSLEIYEPGSTESCWVSFQSDSPFMAINRNDIIEPNLWPGSRAPQTVLRVVNVEHILWEASGISKHKVLVYTEEVDGTRELRLGK